MSINQGMFEVDRPTVGDLGESHTTRIQKAYPKSPIYLKTAEQITDFTRAGVRNWYYNKVLNITNHENTDFPNLDMRFGATPDLQQVEVSENDGDGKPATSYVPNFNSPEPGSVKPETQTTTKGSDLDRYSFGAGRAPFDGPGSDGSLDPKGTSEKQRLKFGDVFQRPAS